MRDLELLPEIRFSGFENEWAKRLFGDIYAFKSTNSFSRENLNYENGRVRNIHYGDIHTKFESLFDVTLEKVPFINHDIDLSRINPDSFIQKGDLVIADASEDYEDVGKTIEIANVNNEEILSGLHTFLARKESEEIATGFASFLMKTRAIRLAVMKIAQGTKVLGISTKQLKKITLVLPKKEEQQKITSFLISVDNEIRNLAMKSKNLENYKKGCLQKLFSQETRFRDENGMEFPNWREVSFGDLYSFGKTNSLAREKLNYEFGEVQNIHYGDIHTKFRSHFQLSFEQVPYINQDVDISRIADENYLKEGDLVIADASEDYEDIGKLIEIIDLNGQRTLAGLHTILARLENNDIELGFMGHLMKTRQVRLQIMRVAQGTKILSISTSRLSKIRINIPSPGEQRKITDFLTSLDESIRLVEKQIVKTAEFKKGLLQKMFF